MLSLAGVWKFTGISEKFDASVYHVVVTGFCEILVNFCP
jgi:hypothetical protein